MLGDKDDENDETFGDSATFDPVSVGEWQVDKKAMNRMAKEKMMFETGGSDQARVEDDADTEGDSALHLSHRHHAPSATAAPQQGAGGGGATNEEEDEDSSETFFDFATAAAAVQLEEPSSITAAAAPAPAVTQQVPASVFHTGVSRTAPAPWSPAAWAKPTTTTAESTSAAWPTTTTTQQKSNNTTNDLPLPLAMLIQAQQSMQQQQQTQQQPTVTASGVFSLAELEARLSKQTPQQQQPTTLGKLGKMAAACSAATPVSNPPFAPFMLDPNESLQWQGGKQRMTEKEIGEVVGSLFRQLFSWTPYTEDFYRLNYYSRNQLATRQQTHYLYQHKPICDCVMPCFVRDTPGVAWQLGKIAPGSTKRPRASVQIVEQEGPKHYEVEATGRMKLTAHRSLLLAIEDAHCWVLDIEDLDRLALSFSPASRSTSQPVLDQFLARRTEICGKLAAWFKARPATELLTIHKGAELFARALRVLPPELRAEIIPVYVGALGTIAATRAAAAAKAWQLQHMHFATEEEAATAAASTKAALLDDAVLRTVQVEAARLTAEVLRRAGPAAVGAAIQELARFPPAAWSELLRLPEALLIIGTVIHRGGELNLHVVAAVPNGTDIMARLAASFNQQAGSQDPTALATQQGNNTTTTEGVTEERAAGMAWMESFPFVYRGIVESLRVLTQWRMAAAASMPPGAAAAGAGSMVLPPAFPAALWEVLVALAVVSSLDQRELMRHVIGGIVAVGGLPQDESNPAVLALHQLLLRSAAYTQQQQSQQQQ